MIRFGVAGNCDRFYAEGHKHSEEAPAFLRGMGLNAYEYAAGHGVGLKDEKAALIGEAAKEAGVAVSIHAPYYINLATPDPEKAERNLDYFMKSAHAVTLMGGQRVVFHPGSPGKEPRQTAFERTLESFLTIRRALDGAGYEQVILCPETMGRPSQLGTLEEIITLCQAEKHALPTIDFAHLHAAGGGGLTSRAAFEQVLDALTAGLGEERMRHFHSHFSRIAYTAKGEKMHMTFADADYGPDFAHLAPVLRKRGLEPVIICESRGTQADDAAAMKQIYEEGAVQKA